MANLSEDYSWVRNVPNLVRGKIYIKFLKIALDYVVVLLTLPFWLPLIGLIALAIKLESPKGPVFFSQQRTGQHGHQIKIIKFRTMVENAEELKKELLHLNKLKWPDFKIINDPRITKIGRILRKTSLDELPQLINVLRGEVSLVGPRPTSFSSDTYKLWHTERFDMKPGITGLWQVLGRSEVLFDERMRMDIVYGEYVSFGLDIYLLFKTVIVVLMQKGAK